MISESLKKATLEILLLSLLKHRDMYPYEMAVTVNRRIGAAYPVLAPVVYPVLRRLEGCGYITVLKTLTRGCRKATIYHLEPAGTVYLENKMAEYFKVADFLRDFHGEP